MIEVYFYHQFCFIRLWVEPSEPLQKTQFSDATEILQLMRNDIGLLNEERLPCRMNLGSR